MLLVRGRPFDFLGGGESGGGMGDLDWVRLFFPQTSGDRIFFRNIQGCKIFSPGIQAILQCRIFFSSGISLQEIFFPSNSVCRIYFF